MTSYLTDPQFIPDSQNVLHGFFGRSGGVSGGVYASLNCGLGTKDSAENVAKNRALVAAGLNVRPDNLLSLKQIHSPVCIYIDKPFTLDARPDADAFVTDVPRIALGILTADCGPVLFYGEKEDGSPIIGAAHAGWGGALKGVLEGTVKVMVEHGAKLNSIEVSIGPCIGRRSYEVKDEFAAPFLAGNPENEHFFRSARKEGHLMFDLPGYIANRLSASGVRNVSITGIDTYPQENGYFSYRRATHNSEQDYGRQISGIVIQS